MMLYHHYNIMCNFVNNYVVNTGSLSSTHAIELPHTSGHKKVGYSYSHKYSVEICARNDDVLTRFPLQHGVMLL